MFPDHVSVREILTAFPLTLKQTVSYVFAVRRNPQRLERPNLIESQPSLAGRALPQNTAAYALAKGQEHSP
jgi:hypothetical protein